MSNENLLDKKAHESVVRERCIDRGFMTPSDPLGKILDLADDVIIFVDHEERILLFNQSAKRIFGYAPQELMGQSLDCLLPSRPVALHRKHMEGTPNFAESQKEERIKILARRKDGTEFSVEASISTVGVNGGSMFTVILRDASQLLVADQRFQDSLREKEALRKKADETTRRLAAIVENSDDAIVGKTLQGIVTSWNRGAERLFGYTAQEMVDSSISRLISPDRVDEMNEILRRIRDGVPVDHYVTERLAKDGRRITVSLTVSPIRDEEGHIVGASKIARDITHERELEEMLRQTQKMEAVGRLAGGVAHDFNNLLTVILGYVTLVNNKLGDKDPLHKALREILRAAEQAQSLTGQLLAFSRKQATQPRELDLNGLVRDVRDMIPRMIGEDIDLVVKLQSETCPVNADAGQLTQVLMNLAVNASDAMLSGGKLTFETHLVSRDEKDLGHRGIRPGGRYALLIVTDTGIGMDSETQAHIFEPFFTTKETGKGTGLGLSTAYGIVEQHGGWIEVLSEPAHGTTFTIYLPACETLPQETHPAVGPCHARSTGTILVVEDQAAIRLLIEDVLVEVGHKVLTAANGRSALLLAAKYEQAIDLLITDVVMPEMSGPEAASRLIDLRPRMKVLYMSGYTDHALLHRCVVEQGTSFLQKPFLPEALLAKVDELFRSASL
jgi:PAS domain S-box-containing protein